jgi:membrane-bound serine protease (ClpP class)
VTLALVLLGVGLCLIVAEVMFPSFGILGVLATGCILGAVATAFAESTNAGVNFLIATAILVPGTILVGLKLLPYSPVARHLVVEGFSFEDGAGIDRRDRTLLGAEGPVEAPLRPAGIARLAGRRVDVVTRGEAIAVGERVRVIELQGNRVVVTRVEGQDESVRTEQAEEGRT